MLIKKIKNKKIILALSVVLMFLTFGRGVAENVAPGTETDPIPSEKRVQQMINSSLTNLQNEINKIKTDNASLINELNKVKANNDTLKNEINKLKQELEKVKQNNQVSQSQQSSQNQNTQNQNNQSQNSQNQTSQNQQKVVLRGKIINVQYNATLREKTSYNSGSKIIAYVPRDAIITINKAVDSNWYYATYNNKSGYIMKKYVQVIK